MHEQGEHICWNILPEAMPIQASVCRHGSKDADFSATEWWCCHRIMCFAEAVTNSTTIPMQ